MNNPVPRDWQGLEVKAGARVLYRSGWARWSIGTVQAVRHVHDRLGWNSDATRYELDVLWSLRQPAGRLASEPSTEIGQNISIGNVTVLVEPMTIGMTRAPFTYSQVASLNAFQAARVMHPFTCPNEHGEARPLIAIDTGWRCSLPGCRYLQDWSHAFMADWSWRMLLPPRNAGWWRGFPDLYDYKIETRGELDNAYVVISHTPCGKYVFGSETGDPDFIDLAGAMLGVSAHECP